MHCISFSLLFKTFVAGQDETKTRCDREMIEPDVYQFDARRLFNWNFFQEFFRLTSSKFTLLL